MKKTIILLLIITNTVLAQIQKTPRPFGNFMEDSIKIGEIVNYYFVYKHDSKQEVFFPDKSYNFAPFELVEKTYFPTKTIKGISTDSAIYKLRTFSIDTLQFLSLPVYIFTKKDSAQIFSKKDTLFVNLGIKTIPKMVKLSDKPFLIPMKIRVNLVFLFLQIATIIIAIFIWWLLFGKIVWAQLKIFTNYRRHIDFKNSFRKNTKTVSKINIENAVNIWKKYMGRLQKRSFVSLTTPEILENIPSQSLEDALKEIDKYIYGNAVTTNLSSAFDTLLNIADTYYSVRKREIITSKKP